MFKTQSLVAIALLTLVTACSLTSTPSLVLAPVGPSLEQAPQNPPPPPTGDGYLEVRSAMCTYASDRQAFRIHTAYGVYKPDGTRIKSVQNAQSLNSPDPQVIALPPGTYAIQAWANDSILVKVPVVIESHRLTRVNLEDGDSGLAKKAKPHQLVRFPDGRIVGWAAPMTSPR
jgi:hypothetical protein